jgi:hypothetical protein
MFSAISSVYFDPDPFGAPIFFFGASGSFVGVAAPLAFTLGFGAAVARFDGFAAVSGMTLVLVRVDEGHGNRFA